MNRRNLVLRSPAVLGGLGLLGSLRTSTAAEAAPVSNAASADAVRARETAFARTMADRDLKAFASFVSEEAVFNANGAAPLVGREAIVNRWKAFYEGPKAPFSWKPDTVVVLASGHLAQTGGPVADENGEVNSRFSSIWRLEPDGQWRVVFDGGYRLCAKPA
jgi:ketosteroid isomerase-like protein